MAGFRTSACLTFFFRDPNSISPPNLISQLWGDDYVRRPSWLPNGFSPPSPRSVVPWPPPFEFLCVSMAGRRREKPSSLVFLAARPFAALSPTLITIVPPRPTFFCSSAPAYPLKPCGRPEVLSFNTLTHPLFSRPRSMLGPPRPLFSGPP